METSIRLVAAILLAMGFSNCSAVEDVSARAPTQGDISAASEADTLLASLTLEPDHVINFYERGPGEGSITESGRITQNRRLTKDLEGKPLTQIYKLLAPANEVPTVLLQADERAIRVTHATPQADKPFSNPSADGSHRLKVFSDSEQQWFRDTFCPGAVKCLQYWDWITSGWDNAWWYKSIAFVNSESSLPGVMYQSRWNGASWDPLSSDTVNPYTWYARWRWVGDSDHAQVYSYKADLNGVSTGTQVSMAVDTAFPCGGNGQACCAPNTLPFGACSDGLTCQDGLPGTCLPPPPPCGLNGLQCCMPGNTCNSGLTCQGGTCMSPPAPGALLGTIWFDTLGDVPYPVTAFIQGSIVSRTGVVGETTFNITTMTEVTPGGPASIGFTAPNLMAGSWSVSVATDVTGTGTCTVYVPGWATFDFSGGTGLHCR